MRRRLKRSTWRHIMVSLLCIVIIGTVFTTAYFTIISNIKKNYRNELRVLSQQLESKKVYVYEVKGDISAGSRITKDNLKYVEVLSEQSGNCFMTEEDIGKAALINIRAGTPILKTMLTDDLTDDSLREMEFNTFFLNSNLTENDYVDIRILYPNGENYIVLGKKAVKNLSLETGYCFMWLSAEEILRISGAIVDCYLNEGSKLYTVKYIEPLIQEAPQVTYTPGTDVIRLIKEDPNVVQTAAKELGVSVRKELEDRLIQFYNDYNGKVTLSGRGSYNPDYEGNTENNNTGNNITEAGKTGNDYAPSEEESGEEIYYVD